MNQEMVQWSEPWLGLDGNGNEVTINVELMMSKEDAIQYARSRWQERAVLKGQAMKRYPSKEELLEDFITTNWAAIVEK